MQRKTKQKVKKRDCLNFRRMRMNLFPDQKFSLGTLFFFFVISQRVGFALGTKLYEILCWLSVGILSDYFIF